MKREWTVYTGDDPFDPNAEVETSVRDLTTCLLRLGGVGAIAPIRRGIRQEDGSIEYVNIGVQFKYDSYAPGINPDPVAEEGDTTEPGVEIVEDVPDVVRELAEERFPGEAEEHIHTLSVTPDEG